jgi:DNA-binding NarL/FixJ family response regulator
MVNIIFIQPDSTFDQTLENVILHEPDWLLLLKAANYETFQERFPKRARIDLAILDSTEIDHIQDLRTLSSEVKIIVLCDIEDYPNALRAFHSGAFGYFTRDGFKRQIPYYIQTVIDGGVLISPIIARYIIDSLTIPISGVGKDTFLLKPKEIEVMHLLSLGYSYEKIASSLGISKNGVRFHMRKIYTKINVNNRVDAVRKWTNRL